MCGCVLAGPSSEVASGGCAVLTNEQPHGANPDLSIIIISRSPTNPVFDQTGSAVPAESTSTLLCRTALWMLLPCARLLSTCWESTTSGTFARQTSYRCVDMCCCDCPGLPYLLCCLFQSLPLLVGCSRSPCLCLCCCPPTQPRQVQNFMRRVLSVSLEPVDTHCPGMTVLALQLKGTAFLWHQVRRMLLLIVCTKDLQRRHVLLPACLCLSPSVASALVYVLPAALNFCLSLLPTAHNCLSSPHLCQTHRSAALLPCC